MPSPFAAAMRAADSAIDQTFAEEVLVEPQASGEYATTDDPDRTPYSAQMVIGTEPSTIKFNNLGRLDGVLPQIAADEVHVWAHEDQLPADRALWPRQNDRLVPVDRPRDQAFIISAVEPDGIGRFMFRCIRTARS